MKVLHQNQRPKTKDTRIEIFRSDLQVDEYWYLPDLLQHKQYRGGELPLKRVDTKRATAVPSKQRSLFFVFFVPQHQIYSTKALAQAIVHTQNKKRTK